MRAARNFLIVALIALGFWALPGGSGTLNVILALLSIAFFAAIAFLGYRLYREHHFTLDSLEPIQRGVLYGSIGLAILTFAASSRLLRRCPRRWRPRSKPAALQSPLTRSAGASR